jgi:putative chitinase
VITPDLLRAAVGCTAERAVTFAGPLSEACALFEINTPARLAAFLTNVGHESGSFRWLAEIWGPTDAQKRYEGRKDLGNTQPGDGERFKGHGLIQTTGRANHRELRPALLLAGYTDVPDFEADPEMLQLPRWAAASAGYFWHSRGLNELADAGDFTRIVRRINGGTNGMADREQRLARARAALATFTGGPVPQQPPAAAPAPARGIPAGEIIPEEPTMAPALLLSLGSALIDVFTPLAKEKITKEMNRHTGNPQVAEQIATAAVETAKALTGKTDPIAATAEVQADPDLLAKVETSALDELAKMGPLLERLHAMDRQDRADNEASMNAAAARAREESWDMSRTLIYGAFGMIGALLMFVGIIAGIQAYKGDIKPEVWAQIAGLIGFATGVGTTIYAYRFGSSRGSASKDAVIAQVSQQRRGT